MATSASTRLEKGNSRALFLVCLAIVVAFSAGAGLTYLWFTRGATTSQEKQHELTGEVFLQLANGEPKHAPGCQVYAFNSMSPRGQEWLDAQFKLIDVIKKKKFREKDVIAAYGIALRAVFSKSYPPEQKSPELMKLEEDRKASATCDSRGRFSLTLPAGVYILIAEGRAGFNDAVWFTSVIVDGPKEISLSSPIASHFVEH